MLFPCKDLPVEDMKYDLGIALAGSCEHCPAHKIATHPPHIGQSCNICHDGMHGLAFRPIFITHASCTSDSLVLTRNSISSGLRAWWAENRCCCYRAACQGARTQVAA